MTIEEFGQLRYGMFVHFGVYSMLGRGPWAMNREGIPVKEYERYAEKFNPEHFNADEICQLAVDGGMKYLVFTTMHHDGFRLYDSKLSDYNVFHYRGRDVIDEVVKSARRHGLKIGLYHSLNNWHDSPDAVSALESKKDYDVFIQNTFNRLKELVSKFTPIDILWYDGWWPFNKIGWQAEKMNAEMRKIQPDLLFNGRNGLPGDFATPEQHLKAPDPYRPWESCMTISESWSYIPQDNVCKTPNEIIRTLIKCAEGRGNLLLNISPLGDGSLRPEQVKNIRAVGQWLREGGEELMNLPLATIEEDWEEGGARMLTSQNHLYLVKFMLPQGQLSLAGFNGKVRSVSVKGIGKLPFIQQGSRIKITLPEILQARLAPILDFECEEDKPHIYRTGGMRIPKADYPRYDPIPAD